MVKYNYSTFKVTLQTTFPNLSNQEINNIIEIFDTYFSGLRQEHVRIQDNSNNHTHFYPIALRKCDHLYEIILGLSPLIHRRYHKACNWILYELFTNIRNFLPNDLECAYHFSLQNMYRIRAGNFKQTKNLQMQHTISTLCVTKQHSSWISADYSILWAYRGTIAGSVSKWSYAYKLMWVHVI